MTTTANREAFEKFFADSRRSRGPSKRPTFERLPDGTYADDHTQRHWWTWQQALAAQPAPDAVPADFVGSVIVGHSVMRGGWCVYEETAPGEFAVIKGPFASQDEANTAMHEAGSATPAPTTDTTGGQHG